MGNKLRSLFFDYGMLGVLLLLCLACSLATIAQQQPTDGWTADRLAGKVAGEHPGGGALVVGLPNEGERAVVAAGRWSSLTAESFVRSARSWAGAPSSWRPSSSNGAAVAGCRP